ncbi:CBF/Mak21 family-domain-containing protein [Desarmillaria tabescens]|uniref:CBF/Mak21 family-domain-containing protein n=1 Tax=Armillaria tabescens TaxID=1929756 RepID=A0AA39NIM2_ARMTA|nr:CBF/Mak21 family-domain-containing protein [Desarmillaria tabescens]KAK0466300.1 CBF/Mak21 family-domain-containing protein [Desarmillaria tabescens]
MVRVRKDKAGPSKGHSKTSTKQDSTAKKDKHNVLQQQISALGGTADDYDLVKNVGPVSVTGSVPVDPKLAKDVSSFLQDLKTGVKTSGKVKSTERQKKEEKPTQKSKKKKSVGTEKKVPPVENHAPPQAEVSEISQLPKKITFSSKSAFIIQPAPQWYSLDLPAIPATSSLPSSADIGSQTSHAASLHSRDIETFKSSSSSQTSEASFLSKIIQSGTLSDRLSALTLLVQSGPIHNVKALETLKSMAERGKGKGGREESLKALRCIVDWWVGGGAPNRKLKYFRDRPVRHPSVTDQHLLLWYFEDWLKKYFFSVLQILETLSLDPLPYVRTQSLNLISTLLRDKPEQEQNLLRLLVNKLGDTDKAICSRASHHILQLLQTHPSMKSVIVNEITSFVLRPIAPPPTSSSTTPAEVANRRIRFNEAEKPKPKPSTEKKVGNPHARYYATITFNQIVLTPDDREVALKLIDLYFEIFKELLGEGDHDGGADHDDPEEKEVVKDKSGRLIDGKRGKGKLKGKGKGKGKMAEIRGAAGFTEVEDANSKLISAILTGVNRALPFAKMDVGDARLSKHIDTLFLITHTSTFNISLQALVLIQQIAASLSTVKASSSSSSALSKSIIDRFYRTLYDSLHDARLASSSKQAMYLNLLFKSIKADVGKVEGERVKALVRRFVQVLVSGGNGATEFVAGGLFLLGELFSTTPGLKEMIYDPPKTDAEAYDPRKRDPQYAHASSSPLWELTPLLHHYHPTISLHARQILSSQPLTASADLSLNTLSHFLDRFVYKNPKKSATTKGASAMQPAASGLDGTGVKLMKGDTSGNVLVNDAAFMKMRIQDVPVDEMFFHKFFARKNERNQSKVEKDASEDEDEDEGDDGSGEEMDLTGDEAAAAGEQIAEDSESEDEEEVWKAMKASMPKAEGDDDLMEDSDIDEDDLPSDFDADEDDDDEPDDDGLSLAEGSDNDDLISLDGDMPEGLIEYDGSGEEEEWGGIDSGNGKRKRTEETKEKRKKFKSLPTFASYEDYAKMIEDGPEDDI